MKMRRLSLYGSLVVVAALVAAVFAGFGGSPEARPVLAGPAVKVMVGGSHGSGVHIGGGYIITAAHVAEAATAFQIRTDTGENASARVLWLNKAYDVALLRLSPKAAARIMAADLSCRVPAKGESIYLDGNPLSLEFVRHWGHVSGRLREEGPWLEVISTDITGGGGLSGGPIFDTAGRVVGIHVGAFRGYAISFAVAGRTLCNMLARS